MARWFPASSETIDFQKLREQVKLFDTIIKEPEKNYVIDLLPEHLKRFFTIFHDTGFDCACREVGIGTGVFFLRTSSDDSPQQAFWIRSMLRTASLTVVTEESIPTPSGIWVPGRRVVVEGRYRETILPQLSATAIQCVENPGFQFSWYYSGRVILPAEVKLELSFFMEKLRYWSAAPGWTERLAI